MDPLMLMLLGGAAFVAAGCWLFVAGWIWLANRRLPRASLAAAGASLAVLVFAAIAMPPGYEPGEHERIKQVHAEFAPALEGYRQQHGAYPATLETAGIKTPNTKYGPLSYAARTDSLGRATYSLSFGDYLQNGFVAFWDSESRDWGMDS
jgi:hypothetical protein